MPLAEVSIKRTEHGIWEIKFDGEDVANRVRAMTVSIDRGLPSIVAEYNCYGQMTIEGQFDVHHHCPAGGRKKDGK